MFTRDQVPKLPMLGGKMMIDLNFFGYIVGHMERK